MQSRELTKDEALAIGREFMLACEGRFDIDLHELPLVFNDSDERYAVEVRLRTNEIPPALMNPVVERGYHLHCIGERDGERGYFVRLMIPKEVADWFGRYVGEHGVPAAPPKQTYLGFTSDGRESASSRVQYEDADPIPHPVLAGEVTL